MRPKEVSWHFQDYLAGWWQTSVPKLTELAQWSGEVLFARPSSGVQEGKSGVPSFIHYGRSFLYMLQWPLYWHSVVYVYNLQNNSWLYTHIYTYMLGMHSNTFLVITLCNRMLTIDHKPRHMIVINGRSPCAVCEIQGLLKDREGGGWLAR